MRRVLAAVLAAAAVLVLADFGTAAAVESAIARQMRDRLGLPEDPATSVGGPSFLLQAATGRYSSVEVSMERVPIGPLRTPEVRVRLYGVRASLGDLVGGTAARFRAAAAEGAVRIGPADVRRLAAAAGGPAAAIERLTMLPVDANRIDRLVRAGADPTLRALDPRNAVRFVATLPVDGEETEVDVLAALVVDPDGALRVVPHDVRGAETDEEVPDALRDALLRAFALRLDPGTLPLRVTPTSVTVPEYNVLEISGARRDVSVGEGEQSGPAARTAGR